jgi:hypothetical protein
MADSAIFDVVFDITKSRGPDNFLLFFGVGVGCLVTLISLFFRRRRWWFGLVFSAVWAAAVGGSGWWSYWSLRSAVAGGHCDHIEGVVEDYNLEPYTGHAPGDRFEVSGRGFEVSNFRISGGYRRSVPYGGVHLAGRYVRICAVGGQIGQLEVRRDLWPDVSSEISFLIQHGNVVTFSERLYRATLALPVRGYRAVWAKDFALSNFDVAIAGSCDGAVDALAPLVIDAANSLSDGSAVVADFRASAICRGSPNPPPAYFQPPPPVHMYGSAGGQVTRVDGH